MFMYSGILLALRSGLRASNLKIADVVSVLATQHHRHRQLAVRSNSCRWRPHSCPWILLIAPKCSSDLALIQHNIWMAAKQHSLTVAPSLACAGSRGSCSLLPLTLRRHMDVAVKCMCTVKVPCGAGIRIE
ncbi:uncharacterized protein LOC125240086 [Leguminivora glycinivorella]|uniref:uncharacterized protein LOC125240086 n=1 Tax=Leguminivora glycinivorella TaxID=1035111 RepID=UPI00200FFA24|nr:uncharacterized protein LOC125240086 [Leguminivora glycinivorella]